MRALLATGLAAMLLPGIACAQSGGTEDRLRDALRRTTIDLRAAQDNQAALQAQLDQASKQRDALQLQVSDLAAKLAAQPAPAAAPKPPPEVSTAELRAAQAQVQSLQAALGKYQASYNEAAGIARGKDAESRLAQQHEKSAEQVIGACEAENAKLLGVAQDILHLYATQDFKDILLGAYEPLLGLKKVELQNIVQDYEDKIRNQKFQRAAAAQPAP